MGWLDGQVALVTGGGSGIGRAVVARYIAEGARVAVIERVATRADDIRREFGEAAIGIAGDVASLADNKRAVAETVRDIRPARHFRRQCRDLRCVREDRRDCRGGARARLRRAVRGQRQGLHLRRQGGVAAELRKTGGCDGLYRVGRRAQFGRRRRPLHRLEARGCRADPPAGGRAGSRDPRQRRRAGRHDDRSARAGDARQRRPLAIRRSRQSPSGCAPAIRCRSRWNPAISPAPTCFSRRATTPAASPARIVTVDAGSTLRQPRAGATDRR